MSLNLKFLNYHDCEDENAFIDFISSKLTGKTNSSCHTGDHVFLCYHSCDDFSCVFPSVWQISMIEELELNSQFQAPLKV
jgi:hypothetical protein